MNNKIKITIGTICLLFIICLIFVFTPLASSKEQNNLYKAKTEGAYTIFINEKGEEKLKLDNAKYDFIGNFYEGKLFVAKTVEKIEYPREDILCDYITKMAIMDAKGDIIKELPYDVLLSLGAYSEGKVYLPEFHDSKAYIPLKDNSYAIVNEKGEKTKTCKEFCFDNDIDVNAKYNDNNFNHNKYYPIDENAPKPFFKKDRLIAYKDKTGKTVIDLDSMLPYEDDIVTNEIDPHFYNGIAVVYADEYINASNMKARYINTKGEFINDEIYDYAEPFWQKLAYVVIGDKYGFINTKGEWVWSDTQKY